ncbi:MAG: hypothetical protein WBO36_03490 [Saprospiraceae bacterium]
MKIIDLSNTSKHKLQQEINKYCGGQDGQKYWRFTVHKGQGGLSFSDGSPDEDTQKYMASIAFYKAGIGVYCRNIYKNYIVLIPDDSITKIELEKNADIIAPYRYSLFYLVKKVGLPDSTALKYLIPKEIVEEHKAIITIRTEDKFLSLILENISHERLTMMLKNTNFVDRLHINIKPLQIKHRR